MALNFPADPAGARGLPSYFTKLGSLFLRYRYRPAVGDSNAANKVLLVLQGAPGQTANLLEAYDSAKNGLFAIGPSGALTDTGGTNRIVLNGTPKTITDASATSLFDVACASGAVCGGALFYTITASDGTDWQSMSGLVTYSAVNKAATLTLAITNVAANDAKAVSAGTITLAWTFVAGTNKGTVKLQPTGSLTETLYTVTYSVFPIIGAVTIV